MKFLESVKYDWMDMLNFNERPFKAKFIPSKIWKDLDTYKNNQKGLSNYVRKWRTKIEFSKEHSKAKWTENYVAIGGEYDPDARRISVQIHTDSFDKFEFNAKTWEYFKYRFIQTIQHELIHFMQYDRRDDQWSNYVVPYKRIKQVEKDEERRYLSNFDEIQAYAHCIFLDYKMHKPNVDISILLSRAKKNRDSKTLHYFLKAFDYDYRNNQAIPKIICQIMKWEHKYDRYFRVKRMPK